MLTHLSRWVRLFRPADSDLAHLTFTVYTREQCCCCHKAIDILEEARLRHGFTIETVDVDSDPVLTDRHGLSVPVVMLNGKVRFKGQVNPVLLDRLLQAEAVNHQESKSHEA